VGLYGSMATTSSADADVLATATDRPPALDDRALFGHPRGLALLFLVEMWERFSYYGMRALLVLYLVHVMRWQDARADNLYGTYTMLAWLMPLAGGYAADRFIGTRRSLVIGALIIAAGDFVLAVQTTPTFYLALVLIVIGTGFFKPNVSTMVGQLYPPGDGRRDSGFTIFYMGINVGALLAPVVCGWLAQSETMRQAMIHAGLNPARSWSWGFAAPGVGMLLGLALYLWFRERYLPGIGLPPSALEAPTARRSGTRDPSPARAPSLTRAEWRRILALLLMFFFVVFFWTVYEQAGTSLNLFADRYVNLHVGSSTIPSSWFQSAQALYVILLGPVFAYLWRRLRDANHEPSTRSKMALGLILIGLGCIFMIYAGHAVDACVGQGAASCAVLSPAWLMLFYLFSVLGELCVSPVGLSYVTKVAPVRYVAFLMGAWFLTNAAANKLAGSLAALGSHLSQAEFFTILLIISVAAGLLLFACVPLLKRLTAGAD
jgi:proton-dependent oligopeptide transporter, POT family